MTEAGQVRVLNRLLLRPAEHEQLHLGRTNLPLTRHAPGRGRCKTVIDGKVAVHGITKKREAWFQAMPRAVTQLL